MLQDTVGNVWKKFGDLTWWPASWVASAVVVGAWGYILYIGVTDPLGGINQLFPLFGIANQLLAAIALTLCTTLLVKHGKLRLVWVTAVPLAWVLVITMTASFQKVFSGDPKVGYFAQRAQYADALARGEVLAPATDEAAMAQVVTNSTVNGVLQSVFRGPGPGGGGQRRGGLRACDPGRRPADDRGAGRALPDRGALRVLPDRGRAGAAGRRAGAAGRRARAVGAAVIGRWWSGLRWYLRALTGRTATTGTSRPAPPRAASR